MPDLTVFRQVRVYMPDGNDVADFRIAFIIGVNNAVTNDVQIIYYIRSVGWQEVGATFDDVSDPPATWTWRDL